MRERKNIMKKNLLLLAVLSSLALSSCGANNQNNTNSQSESQSSQNSEVSSENDTSSNESSSQSSSSIQQSILIEPSAPRNDNFILYVVKDVSSMSSNCKIYVDDMRAQQKRLIQEKGADADYYINDLYGTSGVDITNGVLSGDNGGYRPSGHSNDYLDPIGATIDTHSDVNKGIKIEFTPSDSLKNQEYTIFYGLKKDLSDAKQMSTTTTSVTLKNLLVNQKYYYQIKAGNATSEIATFITGDYPRWIDARPMFNVRDAGGYMTSSGQRIKQGLIFRGGEITADANWKSGMQYTGDGGTRTQDGHIVTQTDASKEVFRGEMGMVGGVEIDLRSGSECGKSGNYNACGFANSGDISYQRKSISSYANGLNNNKSLIKDVFNTFAQADQHHVYYHCYGGADRTGTIAFLLGAMLGMSYTDLVIDFELTSYSSNPSRNYRSHLRNGPYNDWPNMINTLKNSYGFTANKTIKQAAEDYLKNQCQVSQTTIDTIRNIMLEPAK